MSAQPIFDRFRQWLAGRLFLLAGWVHESYAVWLDNAPRRRPDSEDDADTRTDEERAYDLDAAAQPGGGEPW